MSVQPVSSPYADVFTWKSVVTIASNVTSSNLATDHFQVQSDSWFVLMAFLGVTNYDPVAGDFRAVIGAGPAAATTLVSPAVVPNNFKVKITYNSDNPLMTSPMPQGCLCSNGYFGGMQLPIPMIMPPMTTFDFEFYNIATTLLKQADRTTAIDLRIDFGLYGYFCPSEMLSGFLSAFPEYQRQANSGVANWMKSFTNIDTSSLA